MTDPAIPSDETIVARGPIMDSQQGGGGHNFAPGYTMIQVGGEWFTRPGLIASHHRCYRCGNRPGTSYILAKEVVVSRVNECGCLVIRGIM